MVREERKDKIGADIRCYKVIWYNEVQGAATNTSVPVGEVVSADVVKKPVSNGRRRNVTKSRVSSIKIPCSAGIGKTERSIMPGEEYNFSIPTVTLKS